LAIAQRSVHETTQIKAASVGRKNVKGDNGKWAEITREYPRATTDRRKFRGLEKLGGQKGTRASIGGRKNSGAHLACREQHTCSKTVLGGEEWTEY